MFFEKHDDKYFVQFFGDRRVSAGIAQYGFVEYEIPKILYEKCNHQGNTILIYSDNGEVETKRTNCIALAKSTLETMTELKEVVLNSKPYKSGFMSDLSNARDYYVCIEMLKNKDGTLKPIYSPLSVKHKSESFAFDDEKLYFSENNELSM